MLTKCNMTDAIAVLVLTAGDNRYVETSPGGMGKQSPTQSGGLPVAIASKPRASEYACPCHPTAKPVETVTDAKALRGSD